MLRTAGGAWPPPQEWTDNKETWWNGPVISAAWEADLGKLQVQSCLAYRVNPQLVLLQLSGGHMP